LDTNTIITFTLLIGLFFITLSFVLYKRKVLLMLRALFSTRYFQQLLREGKFSNERLFFYPIFLNFITFPCILLVFFHFYTPKLIEDFSPVLIYLITLGGTVTVMAISQLILWYFTTIFNYQEQRYLYSTIKTLYRFCNNLFFIIIIPIIWYTRVPELIFFVYIPFLLIVFLAFIILFLRNINGAYRIHFFIYFCSLEILPYFVLVKLLVANM
jgi:hypothetical protein